MDLIKTRNRINQLDWLKAISVVMVIITHTISTLDQQRIAILIGSPFWIDMAVPIFMIISGFTYAMSAEKNEVNKISDWFMKKNILPKFIKIFIPYIIILLIESLVYLLYTSKELNEFLFASLTGGWGPGSYYVPILFQLLIIFPFMYIMTKRNNLVGIVLLVGFHFAFDIFINSNINFYNEDAIYRLVIIRYFAFLVTGIIIYLKRVTFSEYKIFILLLSTVSLVYIIACNYTVYTPIFFSKWTVTSLPTVFWAMGIVLIGIKILPSNNNNFFNQFFSVIGKASYHIFLTQMVYFNFGLGDFGYMMNVSVCITCGLLFYVTESNISNYVLKNI